MRVPFVDLRRSAVTIRPALDAAFARVLDSGGFVLGDEVERFEEEFARSCGVSHCVGVDSGTSALHLALLDAGVGPGDEVVTTPLTWISTSLAISYCGATPVFADVDPATGNLDPAAVLAKLGPRTRALLPVDLYGNPADLRSFESIAADHGLALVHDACQAHGATVAGKPVGGFGGASCFSFYPAKNLGALGDAGAVVTRSAETAAHLRCLRDHAQAGRHHHVEVGYNHRLDALQAAVLRVKLPHLENWNDQRRAAAARYDKLLEHLDGIVLPSATAGASPNWHLYVIRVDDRDNVRARLEASEVLTAIHYPTPVHLQPAYERLGYRAGDLPAAEEFARSCLSLPMFPGIELAEQELVYRVLVDALERP